MSRISHNTPMKAYDHVADLLQKAGHADARISRADAKELVSGLRKEGRGTEALAAENLFKMLDARDTGAGNQVTGYDLKKDRSFVESKMLENRDVNSDGFSAAEIAKMSTTGRALVELGQVLEAGKTKGRISHATPERGMFHVATLLREAAKTDLISSRADADKFADKLQEKGRGTEALAVRTFFSFIDHRDAAAGSRITDADITRAVDYAGKHLLENKDKDNNGYSKDEIANFSTSAKAFLVIGQMVEAGILESAMPLDGKGVQKALSKAVKGQEFDQMGSEGGAGLRAIHGGGSFTKVDEKAFRKAFDMPKRDIQVLEKFTSEDIRTFIENNARVYKDGKETVDPNKADAAFRTTALLRSLEDLKVIVTGKGDEGSLATYIVGLAPDKSMVGLQTAVVWT
jgi:hypothetical protein